MRQYAPRAAAAFEGMPAAREDAASEYPVIDVGPLLSAGDPNEDVRFILARRREVGRALLAACERFGFFSIVCTIQKESIPWADVVDLLTLNTRDDLPDDFLWEYARHDRSEGCLIETKDLTFAHVDAWFSQKQADKDAYAMTNGRGYQRIGENVTNGRRDQHEAIDFYRPCAVSDGGLRAPHPYIGPNDLNERVDRYAKGMTRIGKYILRALLGAIRKEYLHYRIADDFTEDILEDDIAGCPFWILRLINSPGCDSDGEKTSCGWHTDYGLLTFIHATHPGLQIEVSGKIIDVPHHPEHMVCNVGEMLQLFTDDSLKATRHRVVRKPSDENCARPRISIAFFYEPNYDAVISNRHLTDQSALELGYSSPREVRYADFLRQKVATNFAKVDEDPRA